MPTHQLSWRDATGTGLEESAVDVGELGCHLRGRVLGPASDPFDVTLEVVASDGWRTRRVLLRRDDDAVLDLRADGAGRWSLADGTPLPALDGALDTDVSATPFTNTLPIRRLGLAVGVSADVVTAFVHVPELTLEADPQRYTRLTGHRWLYESRETDFRREITVDAHGFVLDYPGMFFRVP